MNREKGIQKLEYINYFMTKISEHLFEAGYSKTNLYNDPNGASMQADSYLDDINRIALKLLNYEFVKECVGTSYFTIQTPKGEITWKNTNKFLDKEYLITCLAALLNEGRYKAVQSAINTIIK